MLSDDFIRRGRDKRDALSSDLPSAPLSSDLPPVALDKDSVEGGGESGAFGELRVRVTTARGALPVCGAQVYVMPCDTGGKDGSRGGVAAACETDESGLSRLFRLPTERVGNGTAGEAPPCLRYDVEVLAEGFEPAYFCAVPVYEGVTSLQCAELIPKAAGGVRRG